MQVLITALACPHDQVLNFLSAEKWVVAYQNWTRVMVMLDETFRPLPAASPTDLFLQRARPEHCPQDPHYRRNRAIAQPGRQRADKTGKFQPVEIVLVARIPHHEPGASAPAAPVYTAHYATHFIPGTGSPPAKTHAVPTIENDSRPSFRDRGSGRLPHPCSLKGPRAAWGRVRRPVSSRASSERPTRPQKAAQPSLLFQCPAGPRAYRS
jgi:hypothetical protein